MHFSCKLKLALLAGLSFGRLLVADESISLEPLIGSIDSQQFQPVSDKQIQDAKADVQRSLNDLTAYLERSGQKYLDGWTTYLKLDEIQNQLNADSLDASTLVKLRSKQFAGAKGLERPRFVRLREKLDMLVRLVIAKNPDRGERSFNAIVGTLKNAASGIDQQPASGDVSTLNHALNILDGMGQLGDSVQKIRDAYQFPNIVGRISEEFVSKAVDEPVSRQTPVAENILQVNVRGTAHTKGALSADIVPSTDGAKIELHLDGTTHTNTIGYRDPVQIFSTGVTSVAAKKTIVATASEILDCASVACCTTRNSINCIRAMKQGFGSNLIEKVAWKRAYKSKSASERIASQRAALRIQKMMDEQAASPIEKANQRFSTEVRNRLTYRNLYPRDVHLSSTDSEIHLTATQARDRQFAARSAPPEMPKHGLCLQIHSSMIANSAVNYLGGLTLTDEMAAETAEQATGEVPEDLKIRDDEDPWAISFDFNSPIGVSFHDNTATLSIRARQFLKADKPLDRKMEISVKYGLSIEAGRIKLVRRGDVEVTYLDRESQQLSFSEITYRDFVRNKFGSLFKEQIVSEGLDLGENLEKLESIELKYISANNDWLSLGWD